MPVHHPPTYQEFELDRARQRDAAQEQEEINDNGELDFWMEDGNHLPIETPHKLPDPLPIPNPWPMGATAPVFRFLGQLPPPWQRYFRAVLIEASSSSFKYDLALLSLILLAVNGFGFNLNQAKSATDAILERWSQNQEDHEHSNP